MTITIYDVAREAKVSMATVSRVVNNNPNVKEATRIKVKEVIKRLKYTPNAVARGLASKKTTTIGIVLPDIADFSSSEAVSGIESVANMYKYNIILANSCHDKEKEKEIFNSFVSKQVDGIIYLGHSLSDSSKKYLEDINIPVVLSGNIGIDDTFYSININYEEASYNLVKEFLEKGKENISIVISSYESQKAQRIIKGYKKAFSEFNKDFNSKLIVDGYKSYKESSHVLKRIKELDSDVVITMFDEVALSILHQTQDLNMDVPKELEIVSFENTRLLDMSRPKISSVFHPIFDIGAVAMRILTKVIDVEKAKSKGEEYTEDEIETLNSNGKELYLPHRIIHRQTTK
ncbi:LacI family DNA-binding transcriptional regulator [Gemelliphila palaticanis]|uniref:LacI family DNA-binding transcriptional regulator n=1 Tax=Gemelliphila palaticanis TaxID=81950 RepID=A0ABX2T0G8_9BACL|nr:LacI family DNA-binding transcriptional regulator [Gemella palaticanis]MBF0715923.1 LacI family DNA-binding transcriptional regulator [Gemella palaticanis]NYS47853.1 LacI family DNA-binding transcriptional regulator [Gemella palaticanis]